MLAKLGGMLRRRDAEAAGAGSCGLEWRRGYSSGGPCEGCGGWGWGLGWCGCGWGLGWGWGLQLETTLTLLRTEGDPGLPGASVSLVRYTQLSSIQHLNSLYGCSCASVSLVRYTQLYSIQHFNSVYSCCSLRQRQPRPSRAPRPRALASGGPRPVRAAGTGSASRRYSPFNDRDRARSQASEPPAT